MSDEAKVPDWESEVSEFVSPGWGGMKDVYAVSRSEAVILARRMFAEGMRYASFRADFDSTEEIAEKADVIEKGPL